MTNAESMAPEYLSLSQAMQNASTHQAGAEAAAGLAGKQLVSDRDPELRTFVCPTKPNTKFLVQAGKPVIFAPRQDTPLGMEVHGRRDGDVFVQFHSQIVTTKNPVILAWLEAHAGNPDLHEDYHRDKGEEARKCSVPVGLCREWGPGVDAWAEFKMAQTDTSRRNHAIEPSLDIDRLLFESSGAARAVDNGVGAQARQAVEANEAAASQRAQGHQTER